MLMHNDMVSVVVIITKKITILVTIIRTKVNIFPQTFFSLANEKLIVRLISRLERHAEEKTNLEKYYNHNKNCIYTEKKI